LAALNHFTVPFSFTTNSPEHLFVEAAKAKKKLRRKTLVAHC
jgi:hypothetical protein